MKTPWTLSTHHDERYGIWGGNPGGDLPDPDRCAAKVTPPGDRVSRQCSRPRGHGPEGAFCRTHAPNSNAAREALSQQRMAAAREVYRVKALRTHAAPLILALQQIAAGEPDPVGTATRALDAAGIKRWMKG